jgi:DNA polymerase-1
LGLWGDASDNIPGAPGIGEKTAKKLIKEYGSIESILHNVSKLQGKVKETLQTHTEQVMLSKELATICTEVPIKIHDEEMKVSDPDIAKLTVLLDELEFKTIAPRILRMRPASGDVVNEEPARVPNKMQPSLWDLPVPDQIPQKDYKTIKDIKHNYQLVNTSEKIDELISMLEKSKSFCFDTETTGLDPLQSDLVGIAFSVNPHEAYYVPFSHNRDEATLKLEKFRNILQNASIEKIGQNIKYDILVLSTYNIVVKGKLFDTMIAHYLMQPDLRHNMDFLARTYLNYLPVPIEDLIGKKGVNQLNMRLVDVEKIKEYSGEDADITFQLKDIFEPKLKELGLTTLFTDMEMPLIHVLAAIEKTGVKVDEKVLKDYSVILKGELQKLESEIYTLAGSVFNINSPKQLGEVLFDKMKISDDAKLTKTKQYSTGEEELVKYAGKHEIINKILEYRSVQKLISTYVDALPLLINHRTRRLHTSFNQAVTATGRLSSNNPNLQNIPIKEIRGREIRKAFIPGQKDFVFLSADYSQIELRLMAHLSQDAAMMEAFVQNEDIHTATAAKIYKISNADVTREQRSRAKTANFGIIYGISAFGLSQRLNISRTDAKQLIDQYFETYPRVKAYMEECISLARTNGYVETLYGRRRMLSDINSKNGMERGMAERNAINAPIQGSAADIIKIAMIKVYKAFQEKQLCSRMLLQVHDELDFEVASNEIEVVKTIVKYEMENAINLSVPLLVEVGTGVNWMDAH